MKRFLMLSLVAIWATALSYAQGYNIGDKAADFSLKNVDGQMVSLKSFKDAKGFIVIYTTNHCPYAKAYEDRIIAIDKKYKLLGYPVVAINPNDPALNEEDSYEHMISRAKEKGFTFPYLFDQTQEVYRTYGAKRTPHVYVLKKTGSDLIVSYIGAIDDNYQDATKVTTPYLTNALDNLLANKTPDPATTKAIGCSIKDKQYKP